MVRVRFAPSPTGFLHIGGVRTALFNWLYARHHNGKFLLRIEDTDRERSKEEFTQDILQSLSWLGINSDEELVFQSKREKRYQEVAQKLLESGAAYKCFCTPEELDQMRKKAMAEGKKPKYDGRWRERKDAPSDQPFAIRAKLPLDGKISFQDLIRGEVHVDNQELDDFVIVRTSGVPTYQLVVVVDDIDMKISHVIRGDDHLNNTPKQLHLYQALKADLPAFAHLPMILGEDKKKLSKRHGNVSANTYRKEGFLKESLLNFLVRLGWSNGDQEIFSVKEMIEKFDFDAVQKSAAVFNREKLLWLNGQYLREADPKALIQELKENYSEEIAPIQKDMNSELSSRLMGLIQQKIKLLGEAIDHLLPLFQEIKDWDTSSLKWNKKPDLKPKSLEGIKEATLELSSKMKPGKETLEESEISPETIDSILRTIAEKQGIKLGDFMQPIRLALTGRMVSVGVFELLSFYPWERAKDRLQGFFEKNI